jgi:hypothetical protein
MKEPEAIMEKPREQEHAWWLQGLPEADRAAYQVMHDDECQAIRAKVRLMLGGPASQQEKLRAASAREKAGAKVSDFEQAHGLDLSRVYNDV